jgi:hypothetical protein
VSEPGPHFTVRLPKKLVFSLVTVGLVLGVLEVGQRVSSWRVDSRRTPDWDSPRMETIHGMPLTDKTGGIEWTLHPHLIYQNKPNQKNERGTINAQGFRGRDWTKEKTPGKKRVIVLGGSVAYGFAAMADEQVFTAMLEKRSPGVEVLNAGVIGYDSMQELILLESELLDWSPDAIVLFDAWNDFYNAGRTPKDRAIYQFHFDELDEVLVRGSQTAQNVLRTSAFYRGLGERLNDYRLDHPDPTEHDFGSFYDHPNGVARYRRDIALMCEIARDRGFKAIVVTQPERCMRPGELADPEKGYLELKFGRGYVAYARARYPLYAKAAAEAASAAAAVHDDESALLAGEKPELVFTDCVHLTERGNELVAEHLAPIVAKALGP